MLVEGGGMLRSVDVLPLLPPSVCTSDTHKARLITHYTNFNNTPRQPQQEKARMDRLVVAFKGSDLVRTNPLPEDSAYVID